MLAAGKVELPVQRPHPGAGGVRPVRRLARPQPPRLLLERVLRHDPAPGGRGPPPRLRRSRARWSTATCAPRPSWSTSTSACRPRPGPMMTRGEVEKVTANGKLSVHLKDSLLGPEADPRGRPRRAGGRAWSPTRPTARPSATLHDAQRPGREGGERDPARRGARSSSEKLAATRAPRSSTSTTARGPDLPVLQLQLPRLPLHLLPLRDPAHRHLRRGHGARPDGRGAGRRGRAGAPR